MEKENKFKPSDKCLRCEHYCPGEYECHSKWEGYVEEGCDYDEIPNEDCECYEPSIFQLGVEHQIFMEMLLDIQRESKSNGGILGEHLLKRLDEIIKKYYIKN